MTNRISRLNQLIKKELSQIIFREIDFSQDILVTLTRVEVAKDLREANVWISTLPEKKSKKVLEILNKQIYFIQQKLGKRLKMKPIPMINFLEEKKTVEAGKIEAILENLKTG